MGLKFVRDGQDSANLVAMYGVDGQPNNWNFFGNDFTNHISGAHSAALKVLSAWFATATNHIQQVGLKDFSKPVAGNGDAKYPFELKFVPHADVKNLFPEELSAFDAYLDQLASVPENATLYEVQALEQPEELGGKWEKIGDLQLEGKLVKSSWADKNLFFRHDYENADLSEHKDWDKYVPKWSLFGGAKKCPFGFA
jgi:hypothetical protein